MNTVSFRLVVVWSLGIITHTSTHFNERLSHIFVLTQDASLKISGYPKIAQTSRVHRSNPTTHEIHGAIFQRHVYNYNKQRIQTHVNTQVYFMVCFGVGWPQYVGAANTALIVKIASKKTHESALTSRVTYMQYLFKLLRIRFSRAQKNKARLKVCPLCVELIIFI